MTGATITLPAMLAAGAGLSAVLFVIGLVRPNRRSVAHRRLRAMGQMPQERATSSLARRTVVPLVESLGRTAASYLPGGLQQRLATRLDQAGLRVRPGRFLTWWAALGLLLPTTMFLLAMAAGGEPGLRALGALAVWMAAGLLLPWLWLRRRVRLRVQAIDRSLSDAIDLIVTNVESGVGLQSAIINVAQKASGPVADEFNRLVREVSLGRSNQEALESMALRSGSRELALFARAISQAERNGVPIARVLRGHAEELRERRRQQARERANTFPLRITLLTVLFIFPSLFLLILGPVILGIAAYFKG